jgi:DNA-binding transcriptional ArsR family regulator
MNQVEAPWAKVPLSLLRDPELTRNDLALYGLLDYRAGKRGWFWGAQIDFATELKMSARTVSSAVERLLNKGYITTRKGGIKKHNRLVYYILARTIDVPPAKVSSTQPVAETLTQHVAETKTQTPDIDVPTTTAGVKPAEIFDTICSEAGPLHVDVSDPKRYSEAFVGVVEGFSADTFNAYLTQMDKARRRHAKFISEIEDPAQIMPLLVRPRDLRVLCTLANRAYGWSMSELWSSISWAGVSADGHNILQIAADRKRGI